MEFEKTVILDKAGTLSKYISYSERRKLHSLKVVGFLNAEDIREVLDEMCTSEGNYKGVSPDMEFVVDEESSPNMRVLDLSECRYEGGGTFPTMRVKEGALYTKDMHTLLAVPDCRRKFFTIAEGVKEIGEYVFLCFSNLESVLLPDSLSHIKTRAFDYCLNLKELRLPAKTKVIDFRAFNDCPKFQTLYLDSIIPPLLEGYKPHWRFAGESKNLVVKVPAGSLNAYKSADGWKDLKIEEV